MSASNRRIPEPPIILDGARVLEYAPFDPGILEAGASAVMGGVAIDHAAGLAIVEDLAKGTLFLLACNAQWETLAAVGVADAAGAKAEAQASFPGATRLWREYRELTDPERSEVESTRRFLRELIAGDHDV